MSNHNILSIFLLLALVFGGAGVLITSATSKDKTIAAANLKFYPYTNGLGAGGYDVVAYFTDNTATKGTPEIEENYAGMRWQFSSVENRDKFLQSPAAYLPQYGGYCAYAVAGNYLARGAPTAWTIRDKKLYFNYNNSVRRTWLANSKTFISKSEQNWPVLSQKP